MQSLCQAMNICKWSTCQETYANSKELFDHICETHINVMGTQKFTRECKWDGCDSKVERRHHLVSHIRIHVNFKPFVCQHCGKSYKWAHDSKRHVRKCGSNPDSRGPLSAPPQMNGMQSPFGSSSNQMMSPVDYMRSPMDSANWSRMPFPVLNFQNMNMNNQMMMSPTTPPNMQPNHSMMNYNDDQSQNGQSQSQMSSDYDFNPKPLPQLQPLTVQIPLSQNFEPFF